MAGPEACPGCGGGELEPVLELRALPVHGTAVFETATAALEVARGDQALALCRGCGLIFNLAFDPALLDYSGAHEPSQRFSPRFVDYARGLAAAWVQDHALVGRSGCEIGAGDGSFLSLLLEQGVGQMTAVDPALRPGQLTEWGERVEVQSTCFQPGHVAPGTAFVCSRHTLEHIPDVRAFLDSVVEGMRGAGTSLLLLEVPEAGRILGSGAFWDLQYEHCSYFTGPTLLGLLARSGLRRGRRRLTYAEQYLVAEAHLDAGPEPLRPVSPGELEALRGLAQEFARRVRTTLARWGEWFEAAGRAGDEVVVWGGGSKGLTFLNCLRPGAVRRVVDVNRGLQGRYLGGVGLPICAPEELRSNPPRHVLLMNPIYREEVQGLLDGLELTGTELLALEV